MAKRTVSFDNLSLNLGENKKDILLSINLLKLGFVPDDEDKNKPYCLLCCKSLCIDLMRNKKLEDHLKNVHPEHIEKPLTYFQRLNEQRKKKKQLSLAAMFTKQSNSNKRGLQASYELSFLLAKKSRPHTDGEELLKPAFEIYQRTMLDSETAGQQFSSLPLSSNTVRRHIDEIALDVRSQLNDILRNTNFSLTLDESTVRDNETLLLGYVRFRHNSKFVEEMIFCMSLKPASTAQDIYAVVKKYFAESRIPMTNLISTAADGAPALMGRHNGVLKLLKNDNPRMIAVHCIIHRENLVAAVISSELDLLLKKVISVVNWVKSRPSNESLFKQLCMDMDENHVKLLLETSVRWLSKGNCLERFINLYDTILAFVGNREEFQFLKSRKSKALISYVADIFGKLNALNKELEGEQKTLLDCKTIIFGFISKLKYMIAKISTKNLSELPYLSKCEVTNDILRIILEHLSKLVVEFEFRFFDLKLVKFPSWIVQPFLFICTSKEGLEMSDALANELLHLQNDDSIKPIHSSKNQLMWLDSQVSAKYPRLAKVAEQTLLPFPTTYLVERVFDAVMDILTKKRGTSDICGRGDLRASLTRFSPRISLLIFQHEAQGSN